MGGSPPPPCADDQVPKKVKIKRRKKVKLKLPKAMHKNDEDSNRHTSPPPSPPSVPYPYCPPGILYQVNLPYASMLSNFSNSFSFLKSFELFCAAICFLFISVAYARAVAEKGFDIVFQPSNQMPTIGDQPCEAVQPTTPELESQPPPQEYMTEPSSVLTTPPFQNRSIPPFIPNIFPPHQPPQGQPIHSVVPIRATEPPPPAEPPAPPANEGCRIPTLVRATPTELPVDLPYDCSYMDHHMAYDTHAPLNEMHTPPQRLQIPAVVDRGSDNNKIIPIIGHGISSSPSGRHKSKNVHHHHHHHHHHVPVIKNIVEVPTVDFAEQTVLPQYQNDLVSNFTDHPVPELM